MATGNDVSSADNVDHRRAREFERLIRRYIVQVRYGCISEQCTYPQCYSCRERLSKRPSRRPNVFTARMQAYVLATQPDPYAALCRNEPRKASDDEQSSSRTASRGSDEQRKDDKSLTQCLLDTNSFRAFEQTGRFSKKFTDPASPFFPTEGDMCWFGPSRIPSQADGVMCERLWRELKVLFVAPYELRASESSGLYILDPAAEEIIARSWSVLLPPVTFVVQQTLRLTDRLIRAIAARRCHHEIFALQKFSFARQFRLVEAVVQRLVANEKAEAAIYRPNNDPGADPFRIPCLLLSDMVRSLLVLVRQYWTAQHVPSRWETVGAALEIIEDICRIWTELPDLPRSRHNEMTDFARGCFMAQALVKSPTDMTLAKSFLQHTTNPNDRHILTFSFLLSSDTRIRHFRAVNYAAMLGAYRSSQFTELMLRLGFERVVKRRGRAYLDDRLRVARTHFFTLDVRRDTALEDAFDQLRGREQREIVRPLKVLIGRSEGGGEQGLDQGGLTQEFFALMVAKAFNDDYGMFTTDPISRYVWFRPLSPVPLYKYELLGSLFSLAIYNGAIVPVNFPKFLYWRLQTGRTDTSLDDIKDGWPDLFAGLKQLYQWKEEDGEVADVFAREYKFSFLTPDSEEFLLDGWEQTSIGASGIMLEYDLHRLRNPRRLQGPLDYKHPNRAAEQDTTSDERSEHTENDMVTSDNRYGFVRDYVRFLLVESVNEQYDAFARGFYTCLSPKAVSLLDPLLLRQLVEGLQDLDIDELERITKYENGYTSDHKLIRAFWEMVKEWTAQKQKKLLEFVTASDRVPVTGLSTVAFCIVRSGATDLLPTSQTCFGKLTIPEYDDPAVLRRMFDIALENGQGFGVV